MNVSLWRVTDGGGVSEGAEPFRTLQGIFPRMVEGGLGIIVWGAVGGAATRGFLVDCCVWHGVG